MLVRFSAFVASSALALCACKEPERAPPPRPVSSVFSPQTTPPVPLADLADGGLPFETSADPTLLAEIIAKTPKHIAIPTGVRGGTLVGTDTEVHEEPPSAAESSSVSASAAPGKTPKGALLEEGKPDVAVGIPSPAVERALRAQLYYGLVTRCRDADGKTLPPDAVILRFKIDTDGYIVPVSMSAVAVDSRHEAAASCMRRELSASAFRAPASARGVAAMVNATVPSVD